MNLDQLSPQSSHRGTTWLSQNGHHIWASSTSIKIQYMGTNPLLDDKITLVFSPSHFPEKETSDTDLIRFFLYAAVWKCRKIDCFSSFWSWNSPHVQTKTIVQKIFHSTTAEFNPEFLSYINRIYMVLCKWQCLLHLWTWLWKWQFFVSCLNDVQMRTNTQLIIRQVHMGSNQATPWLRAWTKKSWVILTFTRALAKEKPLK